MSDETQAQAPEVRAGQRIAKVMARAGVCSRRDAEAWIAEGRVAVNGSVLTSPAFNVTEADEVRVDGNPLAAPERTRLFLFHKPRGLVTTARDPEGRGTVFSALPPGLPRLVAVGRLDINTEGLLLLTNDGGLARVLELPSTGWLRRYRVRAHGSIDQAALDRLGEGVTIDGVNYQGVEARLDREQGANAWLTLGLREGKNREIKKILEHLGLAVNRLIRVSFGPFELGDLPEGEVMEVRTRVLRDQLGIKLAKEANANFDAPLSLRDEPPPERKPRERTQGERGRRESPGPRPAARGRPDRGTKGPARTERDERPRRAPPKPSTPERRRKHVSALRAEIAADISDTKAPRKRVERSATQDRKGRTVAVERRSREHGVTTGPPRRESPERSRRRGPFDSKAARDGKGRERIPAPHRAGDASRSARERNEEGHEGRQGRKPAERKGDRSGPRGPRREADRRPERGPRSDFKPRGRGPAPRDAPARGRTDERSGRRDRDPGAKTRLGSKTRHPGAKTGPGSARGKGPPPARGKAPPRGKGGPPGRPPRKP